MLHHHVLLPLHIMRTGRTEENNETRYRACGASGGFFSVEDAKQTRDDQDRQILSYRLLNGPSP